MGERRKWWQRKQDVEAVRGDVSGKPVVKFRSDNDLREWRFFWPFGSTMTVLSLSLFMSLRLPFEYSPVVVVPAAVCFILFRWYSTRARKRGSRFSSYDADDL